MLLSSPINPPVEFGQLRTKPLNLYVIRYGIDLIVGAGEHFASPVTDALVSGIRGQTMETCLTRASRIQASEAIWEQPNCSNFGSNHVL